MKKTKTKFICAAVLAVVAVALGITALALSGFAEAFVGANVGKLFFGGAGISALILSISCICTLLAFLLILVLAFLKRKALFLLPALLALLGTAGGLIALASVNHGIRAHLADANVILAIAAAAVGFIDLILVVCFLLIGKQENLVLPSQEPKAELASSEKQEKEPEEEVAEQPAEEAEEVKEETPAQEEKEPSEEPAEEAAMEEKAEPAPVAEAKKAEPAPKGKAKARETKVAGKYEVFPEAGFFKYRLKANNGEILIVSNGYKTREGAKGGILTLKKNVPGGTSKIITDKSGYSQFRIFTSNDARLLVAGEIYPSALNAQNALNSVERFYDAKKIVDLDEIPEAEVREWTIDFPPITPNKNGKVEVAIDEETKKWVGQLIASNGAVLFVTSTYSSKNAVLNAIEKIKVKALAGSMTITSDKQNRYQFKIFSDNGAVILMGETYPSRDSAISAAASVRNFIGDAKIIDTTKAGE